MLRTSWVFCLLVLAACGGSKKATPSGAAGAPGGASGTPGTGGPTGGGSGMAGAAGTSPDGGGADRRPDPGDAGPFYPLDMNDVTILAPLPPSNATPVLLRGTDFADDGTALVPRARFERLARPPDMKPFDTGGPILSAQVYDRLQLVAVRFDLCDRQRPGECPQTEDARMRLVFQPIFADGVAQDAGFHAFYAI